MPRRSVGHNDSAVHRVRGGHVLELRQLRDLRAVRGGLLRARGQLHLVPRLLGGHLVVPERRGLVRVVRERLLLQLDEQRLCRVPG